MINSRFWGQYFHFEQKIMRNGKPIAACFANGLVKQERDTVPTAEIIKALKMDPNIAPVVRNSFIDLFDETKDRMTEMIIGNWET